MQVILVVNWLITLFEDFLLVLLQKQYPESKWNESNVAEFVVTKL